MKNFQKILITLSFTFITTCSRINQESVFANNSETIIKINQASNSTHRSIRDWLKYPAVLVTEQTGDIYAVGDAHGDYDKLALTLKKAGLTDSNGPNPDNIKWQAGKATLVCTGDMIDKWNSSLKVIRLLQNLQSQAQLAGGKVIVTMGNHEAEFLADPTNHKASFFIDELKQAGIAPEDIASGKNPVGEFLRSLPIAARVGSWFFCHAGNTGGLTLDKLKESLESGIDKSGFGADVLINDNSILEARLSPQPWWEKGDPLSTLNSYVSAVGAEHIVMGHQPGKVVFSDNTIRERGTIYQKFGRIFLLDVGMSQGVDNNSGAVLKIQSVNNHTVVNALYSDGKAALIWKN